MFEALEATWHQLIKNTTPTVASFGLMMMARSQNGRLELAVELFDSIPVGERTLQHANILLEAFAFNAEFDAALDFFHKMKHEFQPNQVTYETLLKVYKHKNDTTGFADCLQKMQDAGYTFKDYTMSNVILMLCKQRDSKGVLVMVDEFKRKIADDREFTEFPNLPWALVMRHYFRRGSFMHVRWLYQQMQNEGATQCMYTLRYVMKSVLKLGLLGELEEFLQSDQVLQIQDRLFLKFQLLMCLRLQHKQLFDITLERIKAEEIDVSEVQWMLDMMDEHQMTVKSGPPKQATTAQEIASV
jgi:hypothetical protein